MNQIRINTAHKTASESSHLIVIESAGEAADVEIPRSRIADPAFAGPVREAVLRPRRVRKYLNDLLRLRIAVRIAKAVRLFEEPGVAGRAVVVVGGVGEGGGVVSEDLVVFGGDVERRAGVEVAGAAPSGRLRVDDHLGVASYVGGCVAVAFAAVVLPAAADVDEVELALGASALLDVETEPHSEVRRFGELESGEDRSCYGIRMMKREL